jgi:hypothetical protein
MPPNITPAGTLQQYGARIAEYAAPAAAVLHHHHQAETARGIQATRVPGATLEQHHADSSDSSSDHTRRIDLASGGH